MSLGRVFSLMMMLGVSGCVTQLDVHHSKLCSSIVPDELTQPIKGTVLPVVDGDDSWFKFGDAQTGQLDLANRRNKEVIEIIARCEEHDRSIVIIKRKGHFFKVFS